MRGLRSLCACGPLAVALAAAPAAAWGPTGHRVVGRIAEGHLTPAAAQAVGDLLGAESLARASTWPDEVRSDPAWRHADPWHYISIDDGLTYETAPKNPAGDVIVALTRCEGTLRSAEATAAERVVALRYLVHLVGDLHQPLHVGRTADRGGNTVDVTWQRDPTNLHSVWDSAMIDGEKLSFSELAAFLDHPTAEEVTAWQAGDYLDWLVESIAHRPQVYDIGDGKLSYPYGYRNLPLVHTRLLQGGVRLAGVLNAIFAPSPP
jgi:hypothetical protein